MNLIFLEVDGSPEEVVESLGRLKTLGFTENKEISKGKMAEAGTVMVFTRELKS